MDTLLKVKEKAPIQLQKDNFPANTFIAGISVNTGNYLPLKRIQTSLTCFCHLAFILNAF